MRAKEFIIEAEEKKSWDYDLRNNPWHAVDVEPINETDFEVAVEGPEGQRLHYIIRPIDFIETQPLRFQIDSMDVRDLQTGKTFHVPIPGKDEGWWIQIWDAIDTYFWMSPPLQKQLKKIIDYYMEQGAAAGEFAKNPDLLPGLADRPLHNVGIPADRFVKAYQDMKKVTGQQERRATGIMEVTLVPTVAKSKREHLDVMPNDGKPISRGEETDHMGNLVAEMGNGFQLWSWTDRGTVTYYVFDTSTRTCQLGTTGRPYTTHRNSFVVQGVYSGPKNRYRAADLYAFLILNQGLTLVSDNKQSEGGYKVWKELEQRYGRKINIHGFDTRTDQGVNVTTRDEPDTHVDRADVKRAGPQMKKELGSISRDLRFVASEK